MRPPVLLATLALAAGLAVWANLPEHDPWSEVAPGQPHPRIGARVTLAPQVFAHLPPMELSPRRTPVPAHWRTSLAGLSDERLARALPAPDQQATGPDGRVHRFWYSWCPRGAGDDARWVVHLWTESRAGSVIAVHLVGGGGVLVGEAGLMASAPPIPLPR